MTDLRMPIPIKACHRCWRSYDLAEWEELDELEPPEEPDMVERRRCRCGEPLALDRSGLDQLDLFENIAGYAQDFPNSTRPSRAWGMIMEEARARRMVRRWVRIIVAVTAVAVAMLTTWILW